MKLIETHALKSGTCATKNELVMDLAKTKAQVASSTREPNLIAIYWWATRFAQRYHTYEFFIELARPTRDMALRLFLLCSLFWFFYILFWPLTLFFSFASHFACQQELYQLAHTRFARNTMRYQVCKAQAIIYEQVSIGKIGTNGLANNWCKVAEDLRKLYLSSTIFTHGVECLFLAHEIWDRKSVV